MKIFPLLTTALTAFSLFGVLAAGNVRAEQASALPAQATKACVAVFVTTSLLHAGAGAHGRSGAVIAAGPAGRELCAGARRRRCSWRTCSGLRTGCRLAFC